MRILAPSIAFLIASLFLPGTAHARSAPCPARAIATATIEAVQEAPEQYRGTCVRLRGILAGGRLYVDRQATLQIRDHTADDRRPKRSIVVMKRGRLAPAALAEVSGRVVDCGQQNDFIAAEQAKTSDLLMLGGYCHTSMETYLDRPSVRLLLKAPVARLVEAEVPVERRLLVAAPADVPGSDKAAATGRALLTVIATRDEAGFRRLHNPLAQDIIDTDGADSARTNDWVKEAHKDFIASGRLQSVITTILKSPQRQMRIFIEPDSLADFRKDGADPDRLVSCWCTANDCSGRWPIAPEQVDNAPGRPYFCVFVSSYLLGPSERTVPYVELPRPTTGLAEPLR
jgi:hypothetical protein